MSLISLLAPTTEITKTALLDLSKAELETNLVALGQPKFRAAQIWDWVYKRYVANFEQMSNLPVPLRSTLSQHFTIDPLTPVTQIVSLDRDTQKVLFALPDGNLIEAVLMLYDKRRTLCISSQAGCAMGCTFCATAQGGLARNLTPGEIVAQVLFFARFLTDPTSEPAMNIERPSSVTNIVLMGMGEPLHNYKNVWTALHTLASPDSFALGARNITLSTVGLTSGIDKMADEELQIGLAVSLHAPNDTLRTSLVPINKGIPIADLIEAIERYIDKTHRRVTFEYALMAGINDSLEIAHELAGRIKHLLCHINVIPLNPIPDSKFQPTSDADTQRFVQVLRAAGISATIRLRRGIEINAGCGQLRRSTVQLANAA